MLKHDYEESRKLDPRRDEHRKIIKEIGRITINTLSSAAGLEKRVASLLKPKGDIGQVHLSEADYDYLLCARLLTDETRKALDEQYLFTSHYSKQIKTELAEIADLLRLIQYPDVVDAHS